MKLDDRFIVLNGNGGPVTFSRKVPSTVPGNPPVDENHSWFKTSDDAVEAAKSKMSGNVTKLLVARVTKVIGLPVEVKDVD
jgi:hypothetical protein